jgi:imidazolonepropionase-like amidohydrolase
MMCAAMAEKSPTSPPGSPRRATRRIVIATKMLLDGRGHVLPENRIVVEGSRIVALDPKASPIDYDLRSFAVMPGWIDSHVHITWSFGPNGKNQGADENTQFAAYQSAANAWQTLMAGFTPCKASVRRWIFHFAMRSRKVSFPVRES